ncbi:hypothetical protein BC835DRAFT_18774 [Cytidiella melzeri]|nr:hypothetical protein BC835DRAFT_18774 [Cytidiella melzeri]
MPTTASPLLPYALALLGDINLTFGASVIFGILNGIIFGIGCAQTLLYFHFPHRDKELFKRTIFVLWTLDMVETMLYSMSVYRFTTTALTNPTLFATLGWYTGALLLAGAASTQVMTFVFTYRTWRFSKSFWPWFIVLPTSVVAFGGSIALSAISFLDPSISTLQKRFNWLGYTTCSSTLVVEALLPNTYIWEGLASLVPKLMFNSLLALLNSREHIRNKMATDTLLSIHVTQDIGRETAPADPSLNRNVRVNLDVESSYDSDKGLQSIEMGEMSHTLQDDNTGKQELRV